jgi:hypothetical protein
MPDLMRGYILLIAGAFIILISRQEIEMSWKNGNGACGNAIIPSSHVRIRPLQPYDRDKVLPRLLPVTPCELTDNNPETKEALRRKIAGALRRERALGRAGHWTYDLARHAALVQAQRAEAAATR